MMRASQDRFDPRGGQDRGDGWTDAQLLSDTNNTDRFKTPSEPPGPDTVRIRTDPEPSSSSEDLINLV